MNFVQGDGARQRNEDNIASSRIPLQAVKMENRAAANKLVATSLNSELYAAFSSAWVNSNGNLALTAMDVRVPYEHAAARAYLFNLAPASDPRLADIVSGYAELVAEPNAATLEKAAATTSPKTPCDWPNLVAQGKEKFSALKKDGLLSKDVLGMAFYEASGLSHLFERDNILSARPDIQTDLTSEIAPITEGIALALYKTGRGSTGRDFLALTSTAVAFTNAGREIVRKSARKNAYER